MINRGDAGNELSGRLKRDRRHQWTVGLVHRFSKETLFRFKHC